MSLYTSGQVTPAQSNPLLRQDLHYLLLMNINERTMNDGHGAIYSINPG